MIIRGANTSDRRILRNRRRRHHHLLLIRVATAGITGRITLHCRRHRRHRRQGRLLTARKPAVRGPSHFATTSDGTDFKL